MSKLYILAVILPLVFLGAQAAYFANFQTVTFDPMLDAPLAPADSANSICSILKPLQGKDSSTVLLALIKLQQEKVSADVPEIKLFDLQELCTLNVKIAKAFRQFKKTKKLFYYPEPDQKREKIDISDLKVNGIWGNTAIINGSMYKVGKTFKDDKVKLIKILKNGVVFDVQGRKVTVLKK